MRVKTVVVLGPFSDAEPPLSPEEIEALEREFALGRGGVEIVRDTPRDHLDFMQTCAEVDADAVIFRGLHDPFTGVLPDNVLPFTFIPTEGGRRLERLSLDDA